MVWWSGKCQVSIRWTTGERQVNVIPSELDIVGCETCFFDIYFIILLCSCSPQSSGSKIFRPLSVSVTGQCRCPETLISDPGAVYCVMTPAQEADGQCHQPLTLLSPSVVVWMDIIESVGMSFRTRLKWFCFLHFYCKHMNSLDRLLAKINWCYVSITKHL